MTWQLKGAYDHTRSLSRLGWAWEFLRRNQTFQAAWSHRAASNRQYQMPNATVITRLAGGAEMSDFGVLFRLRSEARCAPRNGFLGSIDLRANSARDRAPTRSARTCADIPFL